MRKSAIRLGMALLVLWTSLVQVQLAHAEVEGDFSYTVAGGKSTVTDYTGGQLGVSIPATLGGFPVTEIGRGAFDTYLTGRPRITSVTIPDSVATLQTYAFRETNLSSVDLPESLTTIGSSAFEGNSLTSIVMPDNMIMIGNYSFYRNKLTSLKLNEGLKNINGGAFDTNLIAKLVLPASLTKVDSQAFYFNQITSVTVLGATTTFGNNVFQNNPGSLKIFGIANSTAATYAASNGHGFVDGTALFLAYSKAQSLLKDHATGTGVGQVPISARNDLTAVKDTARLFIDSISNATTEADLTAAANPLIAANSAFEGTIVQAGNADALGAKIAEANQALTDHPAGTNVGQTTVGARSALQAAVASAQLIYGQAANYTQAPLDAAVADLNAAILAFGITFVQAGDASALGAKIVEANQALTDHPAGTGVGQTFSVDYQALQSAVASAQQIYGQAANYTQTQLDGATATLNAAIGAFEAKIIPAGNPSALQTKLAEARQALTDHPEGTNVGQASAMDRATLQSTINVAQGIYDDASNRTQAQLDSAVANLNGAIAAFGAVIVPAGNASTLGTKLGEARQTLTSHPEGTNVGEASAMDRATLQSAINVAQGIYDDASNRTQAQLDSAVADLNGATAAFGAAIIPAGNPAALQAKLADARQALTDHPAGTNVGEASATDRATLQSAINAAQTIFDDAANRTQAQLNAAVADLDGALDFFEASIVEAGDPALLRSTIAEADQALADHPVGTGVGQSLNGDYIVLQAAVSAARQVVGQAANYTQAQLDDATAILASAIDTFEAAIIPAGDPSALQAKLGEARQALTDHPEGTNVGEASATDRATLQSAIDAAQTIYGDAANRTQAQLDSAVADLIAALTTFATTLIPAGDAAALGQKIADAMQALADHPSGTGVGQTTSGDYSALQSAIAAAQQVFDQADNYTDSQLAETYADLAAALTSFEAAIIPAGNPAALTSLLTEARQALADHPEGSGVGEASGSARSALQSAIDAAQAIVDDAANQTGDQLSAAAVSLTEAMARFEAAWVGLVLTAPADGLYGAGDKLRFTAFYGYEVIVTGSPVLPLRVGADTVAQTVYAPYAGVVGSAITELTFEYEIPAGIADADGLEVAGALELPAGADIARASGGAAALTYATPATGGIRIVAIPPEVALTATPNGSSRQVVSVSTSVYGEAAGNALSALRWLPGNVGVAEFAGGASGTDLLAAKQFTVSANGEYTVYAKDVAGNETVKSVTVNGIGSGGSGPSAPIVPDRPPVSRTTVTVQPDGGITVRVGSSDIERTTRTDGTAIERIQLAERTRAQIVESLKNSKSRTIAIVVDDRESAVETRFPATWIAEIAEAYPDATIETKLNGSGYRLPVSGLDLAALAKRLGTDVSGMTVSIVQERAGQDVRREIERIGASEGFTVQADVIDFKVTLEANGQTLEAREFGGAYVARSIRLAGGTANRNLVAVFYDRAKGKVAFVPTRLVTDPNGKPEAVLNVPHNSLFTVVEVKTRRFADLKGHWAQADAELLASKLLVNGVTSDRYAPAGTLTRAEFSAMLVRGLGLTAKEGKDGVRFADVAETAWYAPMVKAAVEGGLVSGVSSERFAPNEPITREQMAVMIGGALALARYSGEVNATAPGYADREAIASWALAAVTRASEAGILQGSSDGRFKPKAYATRAEAAVMLKRFLQAVRFID